MLLRSLKLCVPCRIRVTVRAKTTTPATSDKQKVNLNVGTIGHVDHGKTTLTAAITKYLSKKNSSTKYVAYDRIDRAEEERVRGITIHASHISYETENRRYSHTDCPGHQDFIKNMICGASQMDGAIVVVAADDGCMPQTNEHLKVCKQLGVEKIIPFINKADLAERDTLELIELEIRDIMGSFKFRESENCPVVYGSARLALDGNTTEYGEPSIEKLLNTMDSYFQVPERDTSSPLFAPIDSAVNVKGRGTVLITTIQKGIVKKNDKVELLGFDTRLQTSVADIQAFGKSLSSAQAGDHVGILCRGLKTEAVRRGMTLVAASGYEMHNHFNAKLYLLSEAEGGRKKPISKKFIMPCTAKTWSLNSRIDVKDEAMLMPGESGEVSLILSKKMLLSVGQNFSILEHGKTVATGIITGTLDDVFLQSTQLARNKL